MAKTKEIAITQSKGAFSIFRRPNAPKEEYNFSDISALRRVLSKEKTRLLHIIKTEKPKSIYDLAKKSGRSFKAVSDDVKLLKKFGFINLVESKEKRKRLKPELVSDTISISLKI